MLLAQTKYVNKNSCCTMNKSCCASPTRCATTAGLGLSLQRAFHRLLQAQMNESSVAVRYLYTPHHGGAGAPQEGDKSDALVYRRCDDTDGLVALWDAA